MADETKMTEEQQEHLEHQGDTLRASWNFALDKMRTDIARYSPDAQDALIALFRWCIDPRHPMRRDDAARRVGCSSNLLYQLYTGVYRNPDKSPRNPSEELIANIRQFLALEAKRYELGATEFVLTPTARKIHTACDLARESQSPVIMWGPSHIGKTWALERYQAENNHGRTFMAELEAASGLGGMVRTLATACAISDKSCTANLLHRIKHALTPNSLLIVDEVHLLKHTYRLNSFFAAIEVLRRIYDYCKCGMVLSWTNLDNLKDAREGELVQLWRRGVHKVALPVMPTKGDLAAILKHAGMEFPERTDEVIVKCGKREISEKPYDVLRQLAKTSGLKSITERLRYAGKLAAKDDAKANWKYFIDAHLIIEKQATPDPEWD